MSSVRSRGSDGGLCGEMLFACGVELILHNIRILLPIVFDVKGLSLAVCRWESQGHFNAWLYCCHARQERTEADARLKKNVEIARNR